MIDSDGRYTYAPDPEFARAGGIDKFSVTIDAGSAYRLSGPAGVFQTLLHTLAQLIGLGGPDSLLVMVTASVAGGSIAGPPLLPTDTPPVRASQ